MGLVRFNAVKMATTAPMKNDIKIMMPIDPKISSSIFFKIKDFIIFHLVGFLKTSFIIMA